MQGMGKHLCGWLCGVVLLLGFPVFARAVESIPGAAHTGAWVVTPQRVVWVSGADTPTAALKAADVAVDNNAICQVDGEVWRCDRPLPSQSVPPVVQVHVPVQARLTVDGVPVPLTTTATTWAEALWARNITLNIADRFVPSLLETPSGQQEANLHRGRPFRVLVGVAAYTLYSAAPTIGEALAEANLAPQGLETTMPIDNAAFPKAREVTLHRVWEGLVLRQLPVAFESKTEPLPDEPLDTVKVVQEGQYGLEVQRVRVRYENGAEVSRTVEASWVAVPPKPRIVGYGTKIVLQTLQTPDGPVKCWRVLQVYATSYSPCRLGVDWCSHTTFSGAPLQRGVIAVKRSWYAYMGGQKVYVPGYGFAIIGDIGGGIPGRKWIDLGFTDEDYESWHQWTTLCFVAPPPPPEKIPWILP